MSWNETIAYCEWLAYRLPSQSEWEYAAAAGNRQPFPRGDTVTPADANFYYDEHGKRVGPGRLTPWAATLPTPSACTTRSVTSWIDDAWHPTLLGASVDSESWPAPPGGRCCAAVRDFLPLATRRDNVGFRVACSLFDEP